MRGRFGAWATGALVGMASMLEAGCVNLGEVANYREPLPRSRTGGPFREFELVHAWTGRSREDLVREWGEPTFMLDVPGFPESPGIVLVFVGRADAVGCIDAFVIDRKPSQTITNYVCR